MTAFGAERKLDCGSLGFRFCSQTGHCPRSSRWSQQQHSCAGCLALTGVRLRSWGTARLTVQAERDFPGLLSRELLSPRSHQRGGPRVACVTLERIALEKAPSATDADRLLGDRDDCALHGDMRCPGALDSLQ